jgi:Tfp pilus assembly protein PilW
MKTRVSGFTLTEILISFVLLSMVFLAAISLYLSSARSFGTLTARDITATYEYAATTIADNIQMANFAATQAGGKQLDVRSDHTCGKIGLASPSNFADDTWRHWAFNNGQRALYYVCDTAPNTTPTAADTTVATELQDADFSFLNPSGAGLNRVVQIVLTPSATAPATQKRVQTAVALSATGTNI